MANDANFVVVLSVWCVFWGAVCGGFDLLELVEQRQGRYLGERDEGSHLRLAAERAAWWLCEIVSTCHCAFVQKSKHAGVMLLEEGKLQARVWMELMWGDGDVVPARTF